MASFLSAVSLYEILQEHLKKETFHEITRNDLALHASRLSKMVKYKANAPPLPTSTALYFDDDSDPDDGTFYTPAGSDDGVCQDPSLIHL